MKTNFLRTNAERGAQEPFFYVLPVALESGEKDARSGCEAVLEASQKVALLDERSRKPLDRLGFYTCPRVALNGGGEDGSKRVENAARSLELFRPGRLPVVLSDLRAVSSELIRVASTRYEDLGVLRFDSRARSRRLENEENAVDPNDCVMTRALEFASDLVMVGVRSWDVEELDWLVERGDLIVSPDALEDDLDSALEKILLELPQNVYLSIDMSAFDPSVAPGVDVPEPGGLSWRQGVEIVETIVSAKNLVGVDVVGVRPLGGANIATEYAAARLVAKIAAAVSRKRTF